jgi:uncharacterized protein affecting Mg2+/Co2+ transport
MAPPSATAAAAASAAARPLYRALLRELARIARARASFPLRAPLDSDTAWGQYRHSPAGAAYEREALAALLPPSGGGDQPPLPVMPDAIFPPAAAPEGSGASAEFEPQRRYGAAELKRLAAANFRAPLASSSAAAAATSADAGPAANAAAALVPRMAQALAALRALPEQLVLERGSSASWHEGVLVEATARFMHASPSTSSSSSSSSSGLRPAMIGGGAMPLGLPPHVQAAAARLLGVGGGGGGSSGNEAGDDEPDDDGADLIEEDEEADDDDNSNSLSDDAQRCRRRRRRQHELLLERRRRAAAAAPFASSQQQHVFTYRVRVTNARRPAAGGKGPRVQVLGREWSIWTGEGELAALVPLSTANAVVGQQPVLPFGGCFEYASGTPLRASSASSSSAGGGRACGSMKGRLALAVQEGSGSGGGKGGGGEGVGAGSAASRITATPLVVPIGEFALVMPDAAFEAPTNGEEADGDERWQWLCAR